MMVAIHKNSILWTMLSSSIAKRFSIAYTRSMLETHACMQVHPLQSLIGYVHPMNTIVWLPVVSINIRNLLGLLTVKYNNTHVHNFNTYVQLRITCTFKKSICYI